MGWLAILLLYEASPLPYYGSQLIFGRLINSISCTKYRHDANGAIYHTDRSGNIYISIFVCLNITSITTCLAFNDFAIYYTASRSVSRLVPAYFPCSRGQRSAARTGFVHKVPTGSTPTTQCKVPVPVTVPVPCSSVSLPFLLRQASSPATTSKSSPPARTPQPPTAKYRYLRLAAPAPSPRAVAPLGYSLEPSLTPPQRAASQGPGPLTSATPSRRSSPLVHPRAGLAER